MNSAFSFLLALVALAPWVAELPQAVNANEAYRRGMQAAKAGNLREALKELERAAAVAPDDPRVHNLTGLVLTQLRRYDEADGAYARALKLAPDFLPARKNRAINSFTRRDFAVASKEFEALSALIPDDFVPPLFLGLVALEGGDTEIALMRLREAEERAALNSQVLIALARVYFLKGQREEALEVSRRLELKSPDLTDAKRFELGVLLAEFGESREAERIFGHLWQQNFRPYDSGFNLALLQYRTRRDEEALRTIDGLIARGMRTGEVLSLQGWTYNRMARLDQAQGSLEEAISVDPDRLEHYLDLSMVHLARGDHQAALQILSRAGDRGLTGDQLLLQIGLVHQASGRMAEAERQYERALEAYPESGATYLALANLLTSTGREEETLSLLARAAETLPHHALIHHVYGGQLLARAESSVSEDLEKAGQVLRRALQLNPRSAETSYLLGKYCLLKKDDLSAENFFHQACALDPRHVESYYRLGRIARQRGDLEKAAELGRIVERLRAEQRAEEKDRFARIVEESVRGPRGREFKNPGNNELSGIEKPR